MSDKQVKLSGLGLKAWQLAHWKGKKDLMDIVKAITACSDDIRHGGIDTYFYDFIRGDVFRRPIQDGILYGITALENVNLYIVDGDMVEMMENEPFIADIIFHMCPAPIVLEIGNLQGSLELVSAAHDHISRANSMGERLKLCDDDVFIYMFLTKHARSICKIESFGYGMKKIPPVFCHIGVKWLIIRLYYLGHYDEICALLDGMTNVNEKYDMIMLVLDGLLKRPSARMKNRRFIMRMVGYLIDLVPAPNWEFGEGKETFSARRIRIAALIRPAIEALAEENMSKTWYYDMLRDSNVCILQYVFMAAASRELGSLCPGRMHILDACMELIDGMPVYPISAIGCHLSMWAFEYCSKRESLFILHDDRKEKTIMPATVAPPMIMPPEGTCKWPEARYMVHEWYLMGVKYMSIAQLEELDTWICEVTFARRSTMHGRIFTSNAIGSLARALHCAGTTVLDAKIALYALGKGMTLEQRRRCPGLCATITVLLGLAPGEESPSLDAIMAERKSKIDKRIEKSFMDSVSRREITHLLAKHWRKINDECDFFVRDGTLDLAGKHDLVYKRVGQLVDNVIRKNARATEKK